MSARGGSSLRRGAALLAILALSGLAIATSAHADPSEYGIESASAALSTSQAGAHPDITVSLRLNREPSGALPSPTKDFFFDLPAGLLANPEAIPQCTAAQLTTTNVNDKSNATGCPQSSQVGVVEVELQDLGSSSSLAPIFEPLYNMVPRYGEPARLGFIADVFPVMVDTALRPSDGYAASAYVKGASSLLAVLSATNTVWGVPADESHDGQRITAYEAVHNNGLPETPTGKRSAGLPPVPYTQGPTRCGVPQGVDITAIPYALPSLEAKAFAPLFPTAGCGLLEFEPDLSIAPSGAQAESGVGLNVGLTFPTEGFEHPNLRAPAAQRKAVVALPEGMTVNPSQAVGLGVCSQAQFAAETADSGPNEGCPESAKIGSVEASSPLSAIPARGALYIAKPRENPFGTLIALYMTLKIPERGVIVKLAGKVEPDPATGRLITTFGEAPYEIPQLPVSSFELRFREGARSPLITPPACGTYLSDATFTSWAGQTAVLHPSFQITAGPGGAACPQGPRPFSPGFEARAGDLRAGAFSPFFMRLSRRDGDQDLTKFSATLPPGLVAKLAGVSSCADQAIAAAKAKSGKAEQQSPSCPASAEIGRVFAGAGVGEVLTWAEGRLYLAGPYNGAPLSVASIVPAVAGPFDVGTVVTRVALRVDPRTGIVRVDGASSDPIPHILAGIPLKVRDIRVHVDRPDFSLNPTSCDPFATTAEIWGGGADVFSSADDSPYPASDRFQVANCERLGFKPRLALKLKGGTKRGGHPALTGAYRPRKGDANLAGMVLRFPRSAFLDQAHIRTICTRVQFAAHACPPGAVYGHARAITPILAQPLEGPVYLRSSDHNLPDFVADLHGLVDVEAVARIDSKAGGIRATFSDVPDAPLSEVVVRMQGQKKGLIVNSTDLCMGEHRVDAKLTAHNAKRAVLRPRMRAGCEGEHSKRHGKRR